MVSQERAERTRQRLLQAAAAEFSLHGFGSTSLQRVSKAAGVTMGALTFHFPTKITLGEAVHAHGSAVTRTVVAQTAVTPTDDPEFPLLRRVIGITLALARLLHEEPIVRAAGRLSRERILGPADWNDSWLPYVEELLEQAATEKELRPGVDPEVVVLLTRCLVSGLQEWAPSAKDPGPLGELSAVWDLVVLGVAGRGHRRPRTGDGAR